MLQRLLAGLLLTLLAATAWAAPTPKVSVDFTISAANSVMVAPGIVEMSADAWTKQQSHPVVKVEFYAGTTLIGSSTTAPYTATWSSVPAGTYSLTARAISDKGDSADSPSVSVNIDAPPTVHLSAPLANTILTAPGSLTLSADAADSDGTIAKVDFYQNGQLIGTATSAPYSLAWSNIAAGSYSLTAVATDNQGAATTSAPIGIAAYHPPTVSLASPADNAIQNLPATFTLTANASADTGRTLSKVEFYQGATLIGAATSAPYTMPWSAIAAGSYSFTAIATDDLGAVTTSAAVTVIANALPSVSLTGPATNTAQAAPATFTLTANAADSDGSITQVDFYQNNQLIGSATTAPYSLTWNNVADGVHSITAVATDNHGATATSSAISLIAATPPTISITAPAANSVATAPASFTLSADAAASSTGQTLSQVEFYQNNQLIGTATSAPYTLTWNNVQPGSYTVTAKAIDQYGIAATSAAVTLIANAAPTVNLSAPAANASYTAPATVTLTANAADNDGSIAKVEFYQGNTLIGTATSAPYTLTWSNIAAGTYSLTAKATDDVGASVTSAAINIGVYNAPTVSLTSPANNTVQNAPASVTLVATANADTGRSVTKVEFYQNNQLLGAATQAPYTLDWNNIAAGSYSLTAKVTDDLGGATISAATTFIANAAPTVGFTAPSNNATAIAPATITLTATATDTDGSLTKVEFYEGANLIATVTAAPYVYEWSNVQPGSYALFARATDDHDAQTTSTAINLTVNANQAPTVQISTPAPNTSYTAPATIHLAADAADSDGNVAKVEFYSGTTLLTTLTTAPYAYDWNNVEPGTYSVTAWAIDERGLATPSEILQITVLNGIPQAYYIHTDQLDTPRLITDGTNTPVWRWDSDPFGSTAANEDPNHTGNRFEYNPRFPGQYHDAETNLNYNYYRDYDASMGRYPQSDPIGLRGGLNTYSYALSNPLRYIDPKGLAGVIVGPGGIPVPIVLPPSGGQSSTGGKSGQIEWPEGFDPDPKPPVSTPTISVDPFPPSNGPNLPENDGGGGICEAALRSCLKVSNVCGPLQPSVKVGCYAFYFVCKAVTMPHDPPPSYPSP